MPRFVFLSSGALLPVAPVGDGREERLPRAALVVSVVFSREEALDLLREVGEAVARGEAEMASYVGHEGLAGVLSSLTGIDIPVNRGQYEACEGDVIVGVTLTRRLAPGEELSEDETRGLLAGLQVTRVLRVTEGLQGLQELEALEEKARKAGLL